MKNTSAFGFPSSSFITSLPAVTVYLISLPLILAECLVTETFSLSSSFFLSSGFSSFLPTSGLLPGLYALARSAGIASAEAGNGDPQARDNGQQAVTYSHSCTFKVAGRNNSTLIAKQENCQPADREPLVRGRRLNRDPHHHGRTCWWNCPDRRAKLPQTILNPAHPPK